MSTLFDQTAAAGLRERIARLTPESKAQWGKMNVGQMLCHVNDGFRMSIGELPVEDKSNVFMRTVVKFLILNVVPMPKSAPAAPELDQMKNGTPPADFERDRENLVATLDRLINLSDSHEWARHPAFGSLTKKQWGVLGYKHVDHHLKQFGV
ncbi:MAG: DUF1569 domain-containing protein [Blastocatellia bacterium]|nr:DUF1569 domain-containing protein [Blastocatellia bacterium]